MDLKQKLLLFEVAELEWRKLYLANPYDNFKPVSSWKEFVKQYENTMPAGMALVKEPPSDIRDRFFENEFFSSEKGLIPEPTNLDEQLIYPPHMNAEIVVFKHLRYLPIMMHTLQFVKISYVLEGNCQFFINNKTYYLKQGDLVIVPPDTKQAFFANGDNDIVVNVIMRRSTFQDSFAPLLMEQNDISEFFLQMLYRRRFSQVVLFNCSEDNNILDIILKLYGESQESIHGSRIIMNSYVLLLFGRLIRTYMDRAKTLIGEKSVDSVSNIIQYIRTNRSTVTLQSTADYFKLGEGYLSRYVKRETGYSFSALLRDLKMREAANLLRTSRLSVEEIIDRVGYSDISNFYRNFKKIYQMTPAEYRNSSN